MGDARKQLKRNTELALKAPDGVTIPHEVWLPPAIRGKAPRIVQDVAVSKAPPSIKENIIRISEETDPIGLLIAIANGQPVASYSVTEDGSLEMVYETLTLKERLHIIRFLADKVIPRMSIQAQEPPAKDTAGWTATLENAAGKS